MCNIAFIMVWSHNSGATALKVSWVRWGLNQWLTDLITTLLVMQPPALPRSANGPASSNVFFFFYVMFVFWFWGHNNNVNWVSRIIPQLIGNQVRGSSVHYWVYQPVGFLQSSSALLPVITINGGPGFPHNYLLPLKHLACQGRQVVFYDQVTHKGNIDSVRDSLDKFSTGPEIKKLELGNSSNCFLLS